MTGLLFTIALLIFASVITVSYFWMFIFPLVGGAPYVPSDRKMVEKMVRLVNLKPGEKVVDLGSGDGRIVIEFAKAGADAHGYEISPFLVWISRFKAQKEGFGSKTKFSKKNFWKEDFSEFDVIAMYQVSYVMNRLEKKLLDELKPGARVVCNAFKFPSWEPHVEEDGIFVYIK